MTNTTRFIVLPDGTCAPLEGCMIIDVPHAEDGECDDAEEWIADNADWGFSITSERAMTGNPSTYYDLINDLLMGYTDEQLMQPPTIQNTPGDRYGPLCIIVTDDSNDCVPSDYIVLTQAGRGV